MALFGRRGPAPRPEPPPPAAPLPVPPFAPDPVAAAGPAPYAGEDPIGVPAGHGVALPADAERLLAAPDRPIWTVPVADEYAGIELWTAVRDAFERTGLWPVLVDDGFWETTAFVGFEEEPEPVGEVDAAQWLTAAAVDPQHGLAQYGRGPVPVVEASDPSDWADQIAEGPDRPDHLLLVPCAAGWEVPGRLGWSGAVNQGVEGDEHTAVLRRWHGLWGAEIVAMGLDTMTLRASAPPATTTDALALATEMALYCADSVFQGVGTVDALVPMAVSGAWTFWWD